MYTPSATYRVQLSSSFTLQQLEEIIDYLHRLGVSTVYASPIFQARAGSTHGYDVTNPLMVSTDIGSEAELEYISRRLQTLRMGWLQDIVPNHMAYDSVNPWVYDLWEKGPQSPFSSYFDVNWEHPDPRYHGKVMIPSLGDSLNNVVDQRQLTLKVGNTGIHFAYYDHRFPLAVSAYPTFLEEFLSAETLEASERALISSWVDRTTAYNAEADHGQEAIASWQSVVTGLWSDLQQHRGMQENLEGWLQEYQQDPARLHHLLDQQNFRLVHWKTTEKEINYRRFFTVNDLICLNAQRPEVFVHYHQQIKQWVDKAYFQGVRVDHIDGLYDPAKYLSDLRQLLGEETYISIEKILEFDERLPFDWPIQGSSGYDFLADINQLFTDPQGEQSLLTYYATWKPVLANYEALVYQNKRYILHHRMQGELDNLMRLLEQSQVLSDDTLVSQHDMVKEALANLLIAFPVYRIYSTHFPFMAEENQVLEKAFVRAQEAVPALAPQLKELQNVFRGEASGDPARDERRLRFIMRCQQFTGPLAAKGVEDTTFYSYFPLVSHNEVGDSPHHLGITTKEFHERLLQRPAHTMNATATHDTKRGEDARLRINVLSELPSEWMKETARWRYANEPYKSSLDDKGGWPESNFEYFIYQTMLGTYPFHTTPEEEDYETRLKDYLLKAAKEAKVNTSWSEPNASYEKSIDHFVTQILQDQDFMTDFLDFAKPIALTAVTYSLAQTLLKATAPGIPDVYQGSEFWDLSMVDPDNRRPVDYPQRQAALAKIESSGVAQRRKMIQELTTHLLDPSVKLFVLWQSLQVRQKRSELFAQGSYEPLEVRGPRKHQVFAFRRRWQQQEVVVIVPLQIARLPLTHSLPLGEVCWKDTQVLLPDSTSTSWHHHFTQQTVSAPGQFSLSDVLGEFPVALLTNSKL